MDKKLKHRKWYIKIQKVVTSRKWFYIMCKGKEQILLIYKGFLKTKRQRKTLLPKDNSKGKTKWNKKWRTYKHLKWCFFHNKKKCKINEEMCHKWWHNGLIILIIVFERNTPRIVAKAVSGCNSVEHYLEKIVKYKMHVSFAPVIIIYIQIIYRFHVCYWYDLIINYKKVINFLTRSSMKEKQTVQGPLSMFYNETFFNSETLKSLLLSFVLNLCGLIFVK